MPKKLDHTVALAHLSRVDRKLARIITKAGECRLQMETTQSIFEALLESIVYQQLNGKVAATILGRVKALFPDNTGRLRTRRGLVARFPTPQQIRDASPELLRSAGLSQAKMLAIKDLAEKTIEGIVPSARQAHKMSDEELIEHLVQVRGIGRWTVEMLLMFRLGRPDVLSADDYGVRKGFAKVHKMTELPKPKELLAYGERWRPHRSVACWYLWRAAEMQDLPFAGAEKKKAERKAAKKSPAKSAERKSPRKAAARKNAGSA
ncbi:MAG: DNA-3-methyladenine glycosylase [Candidatus Korobacteraceae bacterium]